MKPLFIIKSIFECSGAMPFFISDTLGVFAPMYIPVHAPVQSLLFLFLIQAVTFLSWIRIPHRTLLFYCALVCDRRVRVIINPMHFASVPCMIELWHYRNQTTATFTKWRLLPQTCSYFSHEGTHPHVHTFDTSGRVILTQQLPVAHFSQVVWPFKQG